MNSFPKPLNFLILLAVSVGGFSPFEPSQLFSQQTAQTLEGLYAQWQVVDTKLKGIESQMASGVVDDEAKKSYRETVEEATRLVDVLESAAKGKLQSDHTSTLATRILMGITLNAVTKNNDRKALELGDFLIKRGINPKYFEIAGKSERLSIAQREIFDELKIRHEEVMKNDLPRVRLKTSKGDIVLELYENEAPGTVGNFISLVKSGHYDNRLFHRVIEGFIAQSGGYRLEDGKEVGGKGPGYEIQCECYEPDKRLHFTGVISMANRNVRDTGGAEFFFALRRTSELDGRHTVFGRIIEGLEVLENIERTHKTGANGRDIAFPGVLKDSVISAEVLRARDHEYKPVKAKPNENSGGSADDDGPPIELNAPTDPGDGQATDR